MVIHQLTFMLFQSILGVNRYLDSTNESQEGFKAASTKNITHFYGYLA